MSEEFDLQKILSELPEAESRIVSKVVAHAFVLWASFGDEHLDFVCRQLDEYADALIEDYRSAPSRPAAKRSPKMAEPCVYIISNGGTPEMFKIGKTNDIDQRLYALATSCPTKPYVVHAFYTADPYPLEKALHAEFAGKRTHGEWFALSDIDVINAIDAGTALTAPAPAQGEAGR